MKVLKHIKKIMAIGMLGIMLVGAVGCTQKFTQDDVNSMIAEAEAKAIASVDITSNDADVVAAMEPQVIALIESAVAEQAEKDALVLEDVKAIVAELEAEAVAVTVEAEAEVVANDAKYSKDDLVLGSSVTSFTLDDSDLSYLQDKKIEFDNDDNIDIHEELVFNDVSVKTSVSDEDFEGNVYLTLDSVGAIEYKYVFDDDVDRTLVTKDEPLMINFLGKDLEIVDVDADQFTVINGEKVLMKENEEITMNIDGEDVVVKLVSVSDSSEKITVQIGDEVEVGMAEGDVSEVGNSGYEVYVKSVMTNEAGEGDDIAELRIAKDVEQDYEKDEEVVDGDERFVYTMTFTGDMIDSFGVKYNEVSDNIDDEYQPIKVGDELVLPEDFAKISLELDDVDYIDYDFSFATKDDVNAIKIKSSDSEGIHIGDDKVDKVYFNGTHAIYDDDNGDEKVVALSTVDLVNDDLTLDLSYVGTTFKIGTDIEFETDATMAFLGATEGEEDGEDISYDSVEYGTQEEDLVTVEGIVIKSPESNAKSDKVELSVPSDEVKATIVVR